ncbi:hypothetical protein K1719_000888 [Acacia pycnantha]|nr:hypothetical protein K1719_000888 [Acacia pycnantha]
MERSKYKSYEELDFSSCPIWIQVHNVLLEALCLENVVMIGGSVGEGGFGGRSSVQWQPDGNRTWISIRYEKLPNFCYHCGKLGHNNRSCKSKRLMFAVDITEPRFGPWLSMTASCSWEEVTVVIWEEWVEAGYVQLKREEALHQEKRGSDQRTNTKLVVVEEDLFTIRLHKPCKRSQEQEENQLAIIPFNGKVLNEVINVLDGLGLKRNVEEELVSVMAKKRRMGSLRNDIPMSIVSSYADSLKKSKTKTMINSKRKICGEKENLMEEELELDEEMTDHVLPIAVETTFVFKAKRGRKKKTVTDGVGG